jgi:predicted HicB family RNase H-like nuclease
MKTETKKSNSFPLRLPRTMRQEVDKLADSDGISVNHFISLALAEKISRLERYFQTSEASVTPVDE